MKNKFLSSFIELECHSIYTCVINIWEITTPKRYRVFPYKELVRRRREVRERGDEWDAYDSLTNGLIRYPENK